MYQHTHTDGRRLCARARCGNACNINNTCSLSRMSLPRQSPHWSLAQLHHHHQHCVRLSKSDIRHAPARMPSLCLPICDRMLASARWGWCGREGEMCVYMQSIFIRCAYVQHRENLIAMRIPLETPSGGFSVACTKIWRFKKKHHEQTAYTCSSWQIRRAGCMQQIKRKHYKHKHGESRAGCKQPT